MSRHDSGRPPTREVELTVDARPESLPLVRRALGEAAAAVAAPAEVVADLKLAATEACTNSIQHAYSSGDGAADGQITIRISVGSGAIRVEVADAGVGFDPERRRAEPAAGSRGWGRGMGLPIIRAVTDTLEIHSNHAGSRLVFSKGFQRA